MHARLCRNEVLIDDGQKAFRERTADRMKSLEEQVSSTSLPPRLPRAG